MLCRTDAEATRHQGLSYLLVPMEQNEIEIRPIVQITGGSEFNEVFLMMRERKATWQLESRGVDGQ